MKKRFFLTACLVCLCALFPCHGFALPGTVAPLADVSGQYLYYRNYTFPEETYIGFLFYDDTTIAARCFTVETTFSQTGSLVRTISHDVTTYLQLDGAAASLSIIGEKTPPTLSSNDVDAINVIHDLLYELSARRNRLNGADFSRDVTVTSDYAQFGGAVSLTFRGSIPFFNLLSIADEDGEMLLEAQTMGVLESSSDPAFSVFAGFANQPSLLSSSRVKPEDRAFDKQWTSAGTGLLTLNNDALFFSSELSLPGATFLDLKRSLLQSSGTTFICLPQTTVTATQDMLSVKALFFDFGSGTYQCSIKKIKPLAEEFAFQYQELSTFASFYTAHSGYLNTLFD